MTLKQKLAEKERLAQEKVRASGRAEKVPLLPLLQSQLIWGCRQAEGYLRRDCLSIHKLTRSFSLETTRTSSSRA